MENASEHSLKYRNLQIISLLLIAFLRITNLIIVVLITRFFTKNEIAFYYFVITTSLTFVNFAGRGIYVALGRYMSEINENNESEKIHEQISTSNIILLFVLPLMITTYFLINKWFNFVDLFNISLLFLFTGIISIFTGIHRVYIHNAIIKKKIKSYIVYVSSFQILTFLATVLGIVIFKSVIIVFIAIVISQSLAFLFIIPKWKKRFIPSKFSFDFSIKIVKFGIPKLISDNSYSIFYYIISIFILNRLTEAKYADLSVAYSITALVTFIFGNLVANYLPHITSLKSIKTEEASKKMRNDIKNTLQIAILICLGGFLFFLTTAKFLIIIISSKEFINAAVLVIYLFVSQIFDLLTKIVGVGLFIEEKTMLESILSICSLIIGIGLGVLLGIYFGITGYMISIILFSFLRFILVLIFSVRYEKISVGKRFMLKTLLIFLIVVVEYIIFYFVGLVDYSALIVLPSFIVLGYFLRIIDFKQIIFYIFKPTFSYLQHRRNPNKKRI
ncbi:MAG: lipopolysaccharide biosynthesis protein [Candidatus Heimdallarchaeaceae archaeon]